MSPTLYRVGSRCAAIVCNAAKWCCNSALWFAGNHDLCDPHLDLANAEIGIDELVDWWGDCRSVDRFAKQSLDIIMTFYKTAWITMRDERQNAVTVPEPIWMTSRMHEDQAYASMHQSRAHFVIFGRVSHLASRGNNTRMHRAKRRYLTRAHNKVAPREARRVSHSICVARFQPLNARKIPSQSACFWKLYFCICVFIKFLSKVIFCLSLRANAKRAK